MRPIRFILVALLVVASQVASSAESPRDNALFAALGGKSGLTVIVREFTQIVTDDPRINFTFGGVELDKFQSLLFDQLCELSGGPCTYAGRDMRTSHEKLRINDAQFNALAEDLYEAMDRVRVPYRAQNRLMALLAPMRKDIVR